jgi:hypothetical protein
MTSHSTQHEHVRPFAGAERRRRNLVSNIELRSSCEHQECQTIHIEQITSSELNKSTGTYNNVV